MEKLSRKGKEKAIGRMLRGKRKGQKEKRSEQRTGGKKKGL